MFRGGCHTASTSRSRGPREQQADLEQQLLCGAQNGSSEDLNTIAEANSLERETSTGFTTAVNDQITEQEVAGGVRCSDQPAATETALNREPSLRTARARWKLAKTVVKGARAMAQEAERHGVPHTHLPGSVQGIDLKRSPEEWAWLSSHWTADCKMFCVDFSPQQIAMHPQVTNAELPTLLKETRPEWSRVRWINIDGISWDVVQSLALHFNLHPLAVEDVVHIPQRIKADFYEHALYVSLHLITLAAGKDGKAEDVAQQKQKDAYYAGTVTNAVSQPLPTTASLANTPDAKCMSLPPEGPETLLSQEDSPTRLPGRRLGRTTSLTLRRSAAAEPATTATTPSPRRLRASPIGTSRLDSVAMVKCLPAVEDVATTTTADTGITSATLKSGALALKGGSGVPVHKQQVSIFVLDDNTIISIFETAGVHVTRPLLQQLRQPKTLARDTADASYLLCLLLDALADSAYPVVDAYSDIISAAESHIMSGKPHASVTRELHNVQADLATMRRTVLPTLHLVAQLRAHTRDVRGLTHSTSKPMLGQGMAQQVQDETTAAPQTNVPPLVSRVTRTYLGDVQDHLTTLLDALDSQIEACRDLIDLAFNLIAHGTNQAMQALTVVSVLFLPLTFIAGIYGMNFNGTMPELDWRYGYVYFYCLCAVVVIVFLMTMWRMGLMEGIGRRER